MKPQRRRHTEGGAAEHGAAGGERPDEQREQRQHELVDLAEAERVLERFPRQEQRGRRQGRRRAEAGRARDPEERGHQ